MNGSKRSILEKIILIFLFVITLPFILIGALLFIIIYIIIAPIEWLLYYNSFYKKDLNEKYYLFITLTKNYKKYNKLRNSLKYNSIKKYYENNDSILILTKDENHLLKSKSELKLIYNTNKKIYIAINKKYVDKSIINEIKKNIYIILYED